MRSYDSGVIDSWSSWNLAFSKDAGTFYASVLFVLEGLAVLSLPTSVIGSVVVGRLRWVNGWILLGAGTVDFILGLLFQESIRFVRDVASSPIAQMAARSDRQAQEGEVGPCTRSEI